MVRQQGFSLIEVLMVLLIIGIATTTVSIAAFSSSDARKLRQDAERLAQLFSVAQAQARTAGSPIVWIYDTQGYRFTQSPHELFLPAGLARQVGAAQSLDFSSSSPLRPRSWTPDNRSEEHTSELQSLMRISYAVFCL